MGMKEKNKEIQFKNKTELNELEQFYTTNKVDTMMETIEKQKEKITQDIIKYQESRMESTEIKRLNPLIIVNYFFKPITPILSQEPIYSPEKLGMVFDYYCHILAEVNEKLGDFPSSLTSFCKLAGITLSTLRTYKNSPDYNMRVVAEKIYDQIGDENITLSQMGYAKERTTIFKMKSQNELVEKEQPKVNINVVEVPDMERIEERIGKYKRFSSKKKGK